MILHNEDIREVIAEIPHGHKHVRTTLILQDGTEYVLCEATVANLVRAYITIKTHPLTEKVVLRGEKLALRKDGYAEWQLVEAE